MPGFLSPGMAASNAIEEYMLRREELARQARQDQMAQELHVEKLKDLQEARASKKMKEALDIEDRARSRVQEETAGLVPGDELNASLVARARGTQSPLRTSVAPPAPEQMTPPGIIQELSPDGVSGETPVAPMPAGAIRFAGTPAQVKEIETKEAQRRFIENLTKNPQPATGGTGAAQSATARSLGLNMSAADFEPSTSGRVAAGSFEDYILKQYGPNASAAQIAEGRKVYQQADDRPPQTFILPGGMDNKVMGRAIELGKTLTQDPAYRDMLDIQTGAQGVEQGLAQKNGLGDIAAINALQRMVDPGATVREGDVKLIQSANAFMERMNPTYWIARLEKGDKLPEGTRAAMLRLSKELYKVRAKNYDTMTGKKFKGLAKQAGIPFNLIGEDFGDLDEPAVAPDAGGVPQVGGTFQGSKVLSVTPVKE